MRYNHIEMLPDLAFKLIGKKMTLEGGGKGKSPKIPDMTKAAEATAEGNIEAARIAAKANRVSQYTPYGNLIYSQGNGTKDPVFNEAAYNSALRAYNNQSATPPPVFGGGYFDPSQGKIVYPNSTPSAPLKMPNRADYFSQGGTSDPDIWSATQTLSPVEQAKLDKNNALELGLLDTAKKGLNGVDEALSKGFNWDLLPASQINAGQTAQDAIMSRLNPKYSQDEESLRTRLINQGVRAGSQAWDNEFRNFNQGKNDAYTQAGLYGIDVGNKARQQAIQEQEFGRTEGLNMVNALRTGNQVQQPNFVNVPQQATTAGADYLGAAQGQYNAQLGQSNAQNAGQAGLFGGLTGLANTGIQLGSAAGWFSDERLKTNIKRIGTHDKLGIGIYSYIKFGLPEIGVMAQELMKVLPDAVKTHDSGYLMIDLGAL
jgi:hypothetical protein